MRARLGAGLLVVLLAAWGAPSAGRTVTLTLHHSRFGPEHMVVHRGDEVTFVLRNTDPIDHEFILGDRTVQRRHEVGRERHHHGVVPGEISVPAGQTVTTTYEFDRPGLLIFGCHIPGHFAYGMKGVVEVLP